MIYLLYGQDTYRSRQRLKELVAEVRKKYGADLDFHKFDAENDNDEIAALKNFLGSDSLFGNKKLAIIENFLSKFHFDRNMDYRGETSIVIFWERGEVDADKFKKFKSLNVKTEEFKNLTGAQLKNWISEKAKKRGLRLFPAHLERLENIGNDLWAVSNELDKMAVEEPSPGLASRCSEAKPGSSRLATVFNLGDSFLVSKKQGLNDLLQLSAQGEDEFGLFSYLTNHCRTVLLSKYYDKKKQPVADAHKIHPFVVKKATAISKNLTMEEIISKFKKFFEEDAKIKVGISSPRESLDKILLDQ